MKSSVKKRGSSASLGEYDYKRERRVVPKTYPKVVRDRNRDEELHGVCEQQFGHCHEGEEGEEEGVVFY